PPRPDPPAAAPTRAQRTWPRYPPAEAGPAASAPTPRFRRRRNRRPPAAARSRRCTRPSPYGSRPRPPGRRGPTAPRRRPCTAFRGGAAVRRPSARPSSSARRPGTAVDDAREGPGRGDRPQHRGGLVARLALLRLRHGIGHDARARLDVRDAVLHHGRADGDGRVRVAREVQVADDPAVYTAPCGLQL